jgi:hypothetical protein
MMSDTGEPIKLARVKSFNDYRWSIHKLGLGITCGRQGLEPEECVSLCNIKGVVWNGYSLLSFACLSYLSILWADRASMAYSIKE